MSEASVASRAGATWWRPTTWLREDSLWRHPEFSKLFVGQSISVLGSEMTTVALPLTAILTLNATAAEIGFLNTSRTFAFFVLTLFAGVLVDRFRRLPTMVVADIGRAAAIGVIPLLALTGHLTMEVLYASALVAGTLTIVFDLAKTAYLPSILKGEQLIAGNSRIVAVEWAGGTAGAGLGGLLVTAFKPVIPLILDAISFLVSAASLATIRKAEPAPERSEPGARQIFSDIWAGIRVTYKHPYLRPLTLNSAGTNFFAQIVLTLEIFWFVHDLHLSPLSIGIIYACTAVGGVVGAAVTPKFGKRLGFGRTLFGGMVVYRGLTLLPLVAFVGGSEWVSVLLLSIIHFVTLFGVAMSNIGQGSLRMHITPPSMQGRVNAAGRFLYFGILPLGALVAGLLGEAIGVYNTIVLGCVGCTFPALWVYFSPIPRIKALEDVPEGQDRETGELTAIPAT